MIKRFIALTGAAAILSGAALVVPSIPVEKVEAHTPSVSATCSGVQLKATSYDGNKANFWSVTIDGVTTNGTFGASLDKLFEVPQESATTNWSAEIKAFDGSYKESKSGSVGPCGKTTITIPDVAVTPATCKSPGAFSPNFLTWPAAQNPNGYEEQGFRIYLDKAFHGADTYKLTFQPTGPGFNGYPNGTKIVGNTTQTLTIEAQISDEICAGDKPEDKVTYTDWKDEALSCDTDKVAQTRGKTTTSWKRVGQDWVIDPTTAVTVVENGSRDKTDSELELCPPEDKIIVGEWESGKPTCKDHDYEKTRETNSYHFTLVNREWVRDEKPFKTTTESKTVTATAAQIKALNCPITVVNHVQPPTGNLAYTGMDLTGPIVLGTSFLCVGALLLYRRFRPTTV